MLKIKRLAGIRLQRASALSRPAPRRHSRFRLGLAGLSGAALLSLGGLAQTFTPLPQLPDEFPTQQTVQSAPLDQTAGGSEVAVGRAAGASRTVRATAYNSEIGQTDNTPLITATGTRVRPGVIALSRDLLRVFPYGSRVTLHDSAGLLNGRIFVVEDTMNVRLANTIDIWMGSRAQALRWGARTVRITSVR